MKFIITNNPDKIYLPNKKLFFVTFNVGQQGNIRQKQFVVCAECEGMATDIMNRFFKVHGGAYENFTHLNICKLLPTALAIDGERTTQETMLQSNFGLIAAYLHSKWNKFEYAYI